MIGSGVIAILRIFDIGHHLVASYYAKQKSNSPILIFWVFLANLSGFKRGMFLNLDKNLFSLHPVTYSFEFY